MPMSARARRAEGPSGKKAVNVSISGSLLDRARALNVNLSRTLEEALAQVVSERERSVWRERNREAIADYNRRIERVGSFSDGVRRF